MTTFNFTEAQVEAIQRGLKIAYEQARADLSTLLRLDPNSGEVSHLRANMGEAARTHDLFSTRSATAPEKLAEFHNFVDDDQRFGLRPVSDYRELHPGERWAVLIGTDDNTQGVYSVYEKTHQGGLRKIQSSVTLEASQILVRNGSAQTR